MSKQLYRVDYFLATGPRHNYVQSVEHTGEHQDHIKCGLCGQSMRDCHPACTETYEGWIDA